jgi:hypothetical protein
MIITGNNRPHFTIRSIIFLLVFFNCGYAQQIVIPDEWILEKRVIIPGPEYNAGGWHRYFFGDHWRDLWTTPIEIPVIDLKKFAGGIKPYKIGGGFQTKSLRFKDQHGIQYKFRSMDKDPKKTLPKELQETVAADILKDQISSANPYAALVVVPILNAVSILQSEPVLCILPDDEILGEYRNEFANLVGMMEIHPDVDKDDDVAFAGAEKIEGTFELLERFEKDNDESVYATEYLKARLIDMFVGDWDRHTDQWRWARFTIDDNKVWFPIPRDRDQAFSKYDGVFPFIASLAVPQIEHFSDTYPEIEDLTWSGRHIDRRFLIRVNKEQWDSVTNLVVQKLTDPLIEYSVKRLPAEMYKTAGEELTATLKARRDGLKEASETFFHNTLSYVDIRGSNKDEYAEVIRNSDGSVKVMLFNKDKITNAKKGKPFFDHTYYKEYTKEIRLMLYDGDDKAVVSGNTEKSIPVYISGDKGKDELIDSSEVKTFLPFINPFSVYTQFFDEGKKTTFVKGTNTSIRHKELPEPKDEFEKYEPQLRTWGHDWKFAPWLGANPDDGLFIGGGPVLYELGFMTKPYVYRMELVAGAATFPWKFRLRYKGEFYSIFDNNKITLEVKSSGLEVINFFGLGNSTTRYSDLEDRDYYKAKQQQFIFNPEIEFAFDSTAAIYAGYRLLFADTDLEDRTMISDLRPYGSRNMILHSFTIRFEYDTRDNEIIPLSGLLLNAAGTFYPSHKKDMSSFFKLKGSISGFMPLFSLPYSSLALRVSGEKIWGKFPFFESAFLGGLESLRGFERNRFAGDASVSSNAEVRLFITDFKLIVPVYFGITGFADAGRVFVKNLSETKKIHKSFGGGVWFSFITPDILVSTYAAVSDDDEGYYLTTGYAF